MEVKQIIVVFFSALLITSTFGIAIGVDHGKNLEDNEVDSSLTSDGYVVHEPIRIDNNTDFAETAQTEGWSGDGSEGNPYIIEGYEIDGTGYGYCIYIGNTTDHFVVRDCYLHDASGNSNHPYFTESGLTLYSVQNGSLTNNTVSSNNYGGIYLTSSSRNTIAKNNASNNDKGIYLESSSSNTITNNNASNNDLGIHLHSSSSNTVANTIAKNNVSNNDKGIYLTPSSNSNTITNNNVSNNLDGIYLYMTFRNTIANNKVSNNDKGILLHSSNHNTVANSNVSDNDEGIYFVVSNKNTITNNNVSDNDEGISLHSCSRNTIAKNNVSNNWYGIYLYSCSSNTIANNNVSSNNWYGIYLYWYSNKNIIFHNNFINNTNQAYDDGTNQWYSSYPKGGNYWSDYTGIDEYSGPNQDQAGSDGIGDTNYSIVWGSSNVDIYPLMKPHDLIPPKAKAGDDIKVLVGERFKLDGSNSSDNRGIVNYTWKIGDEEYYNKTFYHKFSNTGIYNITLTVTDNCGNIDNDTITVKVKDEDNGEIPGIPLIIFLAVTLIMSIVYSYEKDIKML